MRHSHFCLGCHYQWTHHYSKCPYSDGDCLCIHCCINGPDLIFNALKGDTEWWKTMQEHRKKVGSPNDARED